MCAWGQHAQRGSGTVQRQLSHLAAQPEGRSRPWELRLRSARLEWEDLVGIVQAGRGGGGGGSGIGGVAVDLERHPVSPHRGGR